jgi:hypothetical protein
LNLEDSVIRISDTFNKAYYGAAVLPPDILSAKVQSASGQVRGRLNRMAGRQRPALRKLQSLAPSLIPRQVAASASFRGGAENLLLKAISRRSGWAVLGEVVSLGMRLFGSDEAVFERDCCRPLLNG